MRGGRSPLYGGCGGSFQKAVDRIVHHKNGLRRGIAGIDPGKEYQRKVGRKAIRIRGAGKQHETGDILPRRDPGGFGEEGRKSRPSVGKAPGKGGGRDFSQGRPRQEGPAGCGGAERPSAAEAGGGAACGIQVGGRVGEHENRKRSFGISGGRPSDYRGRDLGIGVGIRERLPAIAVGKQHCAGSAGHRRHRLDDGFRSRVGDQQGGPYGAEQGKGCGKAPERGAARPVEGLEGRVGYHHYGRPKEECRKEGQEQYRRRDGDPP